MSPVRALAPRARSSLQCLAQRPSSRPLLPRAPNRPYHSDEHDDPPPFTAAEESILAAALSHVPTHGFTSAALTLGARDAGYPDASTNLFPKGPFDLVRYHLVTQRLALKERIQFPHDRLGVGAKVRLLALGRLRANQAIIHRWQEALALMSRPSHIRPSLLELHALSDEIWHLASDGSVDASWYTKRATLSTIYASSEIFMTTDRSEGFVDTERFLDRRLEESRAMGETVGGVKQLISFSAMGAVNWGRSKGWGI